MCGGAIHCDLWHHRRVASLCLFYKILAMITTLLGLSFLQLVVHQLG